MSLNRINVLTVLDPLDVPNWVSMGLLAGYLEDVSKGVYGGYAPLSVLLEGSQIFAIKVMALSYCVYILFL
jgi:hypothetical protein